MVIKYQIVYWVQVSNVVLNIVLWLFSISTDRRTLILYIAYERFENQNVDTVMIFLLKL